jgi:hypothetical protein
LYPDLESGSSGKKMKEKNALFSNFLWFLEVKGTGMYEVSVVHTGTFSIFYVKF